MFRFICALALATVSFSDAAAVVQHALRRTLRHSGSANIIISMVGGNSEPLGTIQRSFYSTRTHKINALVDALEQHATISQGSVKELLHQRRFSASKVTSFWASNKMYIENASPLLVEELSKIPNVAEIHQEHIVVLDPLIESERAMNASAAIQWGIAKVQAEQVWKTGNKGQGILVSTIDTGVRGTHEILKDNYVGNDKHGWFDPYTNSKTPNDGNGHGSHTMGTICGANGYGVAPEAKWMACKGCDTNRCTEAALLGCGEFTLCPTDTDGNNKDCSLAPHLSSNSWGGGSNQPWYQETVDAWQAAGIVPIFAMGNSGPRCGSANSPGDYANVIGVGASTSFDSLASFSSVGPSRSGLMKPEISAPGQDVASAWFNSDSSYKQISGTSMACPHTAGVVALMLASAADLKYEGIKQALTMSANTNLKNPDKNCGNIDDEYYPNNMFGYGVVNALGAIDSIGKPTPTPPSPPPTKPAPPPGNGCKFDFAVMECVPEDLCQQCILDCPAEYCARR